MHCILHILSLVIRMRQKQWNNETVLTIRVYSEVCNNMMLILSFHKHKLNDRSSITKKNVHNKWNERIVYVTLSDDSTPAREMPAKSAAAAQYVLLHSCKSFYHWSRGAGGKQKTNNQNGNKRRNGNDHKNEVQWNLSKTTACGPVLTDHYREVAALQR